MPPNDSGSESGSQARGKPNPKSLRTILGLYCLIQQQYIIDHIIPKPAPPPTRHSKLLRTLVALASVLVRDDEIVAVAVADEVPSAMSVLVADEKELALSSLITCKNPDSHGRKNKKGYSITETKMKKVDLDHYLLEQATWAQQPFLEHVALVARFINQRLDGTAWREFMFYVFTQAAPKMQRRFLAKKHARLWSDIIQLRPSELIWRNFEPNLNPNAFDRVFLTTLRGNTGLVVMKSIMQNLERHRQSRLAAPYGPILDALSSQRPRTASDLFPKLMKVDPENPCILTQETYHEFHQLLCLLILGYKRSVDLLTSWKKKPQPPKYSDLVFVVGDIKWYMLLLHPLAYSTAITKHFRMVAVAVQRPQPLAGLGVGGEPGNVVEDNMQETVETKGTGEDGDDGRDLDVIDNDGNKDDEDVDVDEDQDEDIEDDVDEDQDVADDDGDSDDAGDSNADDAGDSDADDADDTDDECDANDIMDVDQAFSRGDSYVTWLKLQVTYYDAVRTLRKLPPANTKITIKLFSTPLVSQSRTPWRDVVGEIFNNLVPSSPDGKNPDAPNVLETLENMAKANPEFSAGLDSLSKGGDTCKARTHCEASIVGLMFASEQSTKNEKVKFSWKDIQYLKYSVLAIGVSKRCCPICACLLQEFCREHKHPIEILGSHAQVTPCPLPPWLPEHVAENIVSKFASDLRIILSQLGRISRRRTASATSVETAALSDDEDSDMNDLRSHETEAEAEVRRRETEMYLY